MPIQPLTAALDMLGRDSRLGTNASETVSYLMDLLYYGEFDILEQVSSGEAYERVNLIGTKGHEGHDSPLWLIGAFNSGADPTPAAWPHQGGEGFSPRNDPASGLLYGFGANAKIDIVLKILAASRFRTEELVRPVYIAAVSGEEAVGSGVRSLVSAGPNPRGVAMVGAPTNLELWSDHPGCVTIKFELTRRLRHRRMPPSRGFFEIQVDGRSAHAQCAALGEDAIVLGLRVLARLRAFGELRLLEFDAGESGNRVAGRCRMRIATSFDDLPDLGPGVSARPIEDGAALPFPIGNLFRSWLRARDAGVAALRDRLGLARNALGARPTTAIWTGRLVTDRNAVEGHLTFWTGPGVGIQDLCETFASAVQQALVGMEELEVDIVVLQDRPPLATAGEGGELLDTAKFAMRKTGLVPAVTGGTLTSDAGLLRSVGIPSLVFGPGRGAGDLYRDDEAIPVAHIDAAYRFYVALIERWCTRPR